MKFVNSCLWGVIFSSFFYVNLFCADENKVNEKEYQIYTQAQNLYEKKQLPEAIKIIDDFEKAIKGDLYYSLYELRASLYAQQGKFDSAVKDYAKAYRLHKTRENVNGLAYTYLILNDAINAETIFRDGMVNFDDNLYFKKGLLQALLMQERYREVAAIAESLLATNPTDVELLILAGQTYRMLGENDKAWEDLKFVQYQEKATKKELEIMIDIALEKKLWANAESLAENIVKMDQQVSYSRLYNLIVVLLQNEQIEKAEKWITLALKTTKSEKLLVYLAEAIRLKDPEKSLTLLQSIKDPEVMQGRYYLILGDLTLRAGDKLKAKSIFREAASFNDTRKPALWQLFAMARNDNNAQECIKTLTELSELDPENSSVQKFLDYYRK